MSTNTNLHNARVSKNDEFYTQLKDVSKELMYYRHHFKDKVVLCNCNDSDKSAFWQYFHLNFEFLGLKKLISTTYDRDASSYKMEYSGGSDSDVGIYVRALLDGDGDFRSDECIELLKESDIVVTNPPFSLFREYVAQLIEYDKKFLIIGNKNSVKYREIFPLIKSERLWIGYSTPSEFRVDSGITSKVKGMCRWFTNLDILDRHSKIDLYRKWGDIRYDVYDELPSVIKVDRTIDIPIDYDGYMGVPITYLDNYNAIEYELVDMLNRYTVLDYFKVNDDVRRRHSHCCNINGVPTFSRVVIRKRKLND